MVDAHLRLKTINTEDIKNLIIGGQTGIDGIRFVLASSVNGEDLTNASFTWYLQYKNKYGQGESVVLDATVEDNLVKLTWVPDSLASQVPGRLQIQLYATIVEGVGQAAVVTTRWVSEPALIYVQENLSPDPIIQTELSVFDYYLTMYSSFKEAAESAAAAALASAQAAEASKDNAAQSETTAAQSAAASGDAAIVSQEAEALINAKLLGAFAADPATASAGAVYYNTVQKVLKVYDADSSTWKVAYADASQVGYDNVSSELASDNVQNAIDENANSIGALQTGKENTSNKKSTLVENSEAFFPNQKAVNDGLATKTSKSQIAYDDDTATFMTNALSSGAIIERGSNANGEYVKFVDGTMMCWRNIAFDFTEEYVQYYTYPVVFVSNALSAGLTVNDYSFGTGDYDLRQSITSIVIRSRDLNKWGLLRGDTNSTETAFSLRLWAIGRWK